MATPTDQQFESDVEEAAQTAIDAHFDADENKEQVSTLTQNTADVSATIQDCAEAANKELKVLEDKYSLIVSLLTSPSDAQGLGLTLPAYDKWLKELRSHLDPTAGQRLWNEFGSRIPHPSTPIRNNQTFTHENLTTWGAAVYDAFQYGPIGRGHDRPAWDGRDGGATRRRAAMINVQLDVDTTGTLKSREKSLGAEFLKGTHVADWGLSGKFLRTTGHLGQGTDFATSKWDEYAFLKWEVQAGTDNISDYSYCRIQDYPSGWQTGLMLLLKIVSTLAGQSLETSANTPGDGLTLVNGSTKIDDPANSAEAILKAEAGLQRIWYPHYRSHFLDWSSLDAARRVDANLNDRTSANNQHGSYLGFRATTKGDTGTVSGQLTEKEDFISSAGPLCQALAAAAAQLTKLSKTDSVSEQAISAKQANDSRYNEMLSRNVQEGLERSGKILADITSWLSPLFGDKNQDTGLGAHYACILKAANEQVQTNDAIEKLLGDVKGLDKKPDWYEDADDAAKKRFDDAVQSAIDEKRNLLELAKAETEGAEEALSLAQIERHLFNEQCFLLSFIDVFSVHKVEWLDPWTGPTSQANKRLPYIESTNNTNPAKKNATLLVNGDPYAFINKLTLSPKLQSLMDIPNHALSSIQPRIRLFKVVNPALDTTTDSELSPYEVEMNFDSNATENDLELFMRNGSRNFGAGIKSFNFSYEGSNPFAVKKSIKANLKIFANSMEELFVERTGHNGKKYKYVDLVLKTGGNSLTNAKTQSECAGTADTTRQNIELADLNFRLKAQVGLASPVGSDMSAVPSDVRSALKESFVTLNLTPTVHNFEIDDLGRVIMNINYLAYAEEFFDSSHFNIFADARIGSDPVADLISLARLKRKMALEHVARKCDSQAKRTLQEEYRKEVVSEVQSSIGYLIQSMIVQQKIRYLEIPTEEVRNIDSLTTAAREELADKVERSLTDLANGTSTPDVAAADAGLKKKISKSLEVLGDEEASDDAVAIALMSGDYVNTTLAYFYISDLIDVILVNIESELATMITDLEKTVKEGQFKNFKTPNGTPIVVGAPLIESKKREIEATRESFKKLRILLGPVEFSSHNKSYNPQVTLGDIPISVKYFVGFLTDKMLKKNQSLYSLTKFLNDLFNILVRDFLNGQGCAAGSKQKIRVQQSALTSYSPLTDDINPESLDIVTLALTPPPSAGGTAGIKNFRTSISQLTNDGIPGAILNVSGPAGSAQTTIPIKNEFNFFVYSAGQVQPLEKMKGDRQSDERRGIFHYILGRDRGLIKNIKLTKTQTKGLAEVRFEQDGYDGLQQMRVIYDVQIDSYANVNTWPGTYLYVDPLGFLPHSKATPDLTKIGIGGYYMIIRSEHEFGPGLANTTIHAKWVNSIENDAIDANCRELEAQAHGSGDQANPECRFVDPPREPEPPDTEDKLFDLKWEGWTPW